MRRILVIPHHLLDSVSGSFLDRRSFKVRSVADVAEALETVALWPPHLIVFSSAQDDVPAADFVRMVRGDKRLAATKLLMLSPEPVGVAPSSISEAEVDGHLISPISGADLVNTVGILLDVSTRRAPRLTCNLLARIDLASADTSGMLANVLGLSETGLLLECEQRLAVGDLIGIQFTVPDIGRVGARCIVLKVDEMVLHYGCQMVELDEQSREVIRELVARHTEPGDGQQGAG